MSNILQSPFPNLEIDRHLIAEFLHAVAPDAERFIIGTGIDNAALRKQAGAQGSPAYMEARVRLQAHFDLLERRQRDGYGAFYCINLLANGPRSSASVRFSRAIYRDLDTPAGRPLPLPPSFSVLTSTRLDARGGTYSRTQDIYLVDQADPLPAAAFHRIMKVVTTAFGGDPAAKDIVRMLRLPGTYNLKDLDNPQLVTLISGSGVRYRATTLIEAFEPDPEDPPPHKSAMDRSPAVGDDLDTLRNALAHLSPDSCYVEWLSVGMGLHSATSGSESGLIIWIEWSSRSRSFDPVECRKKWASFKRTGIGAGTIYYLAKRAGYRFVRRGAQGRR